METILIIISACLLFCLLLLANLRFNLNNKLTTSNTKYKELVDRHTLSLEKRDGLAKEKDDILRRLYSLEDETKEKLNKEFEAWKILHEESIREDALRRSRSVMRGQATEHLAPLTLPSMNPKDFRFMGNPIDYVVFCGVSDITDKQKDAIDKIVFLEIKSGKSKLNKVQRRIRDAIKEGKVEFTIYNPDTSSISTTKLKQEE